jgi:DNA glycosylase AlkZ-like
MTVIPEELIYAYRAQTFRWLPGLRLKERQEAVDFVKERGFVFFWPITGFLLTSLWVATAGDRPVADEHDDPGHVTWGWKDALLGSQEWYYAKVLRKKATMISHELAPFFYALSENYGAYDEDYLTLYEQGRFTLEAKLLYEALLDQGPLDTVELRKATHLTSPSSETRFNRAISDLQADFKILPVGVTSSGAWHYAFAYDIVARRYPELPDRAHEIQENRAREKLLETYLRSLGAAPLNQAARLFRWSIEDAGRAVDGLIQTGLVTRAMEVKNQPGEWLASAELFQGISR